MISKTGLPTRINIGGVIRTICWTIFILYALVRSGEAHRIIHYPNYPPTSAAQQAGIATEYLLYIITWYCIVKAIDSISRR